MAQPGDKTAAICVGELIVDFISLEPGKPLAAAERFAKCAGGAPANVAVGLQHHGIQAALWSRVGRDSLGAFARAQARARGLAVDGVSVDPRRPTRFALVAPAANGAREIEIHNRDSADQYLRPEDVPAERLRHARLFHFGGTTLLGGETTSTLFGLLPAARRHGCLISFDPNIRVGRARADLRARLRAALAYVDVLQTSADAWTDLWEGDGPEALLEAGPSLVVRTRGEEGAWLRTRRHDVHVPAAPATPADPTGAGDAFLAALLAGLARDGAPPADLTAAALHAHGLAAAAHAAHIVGRYGAMTAYPAAETDQAL